MQTFSLNTSASAQKALNDAVSKNETNVNKMVSDAEKTPFEKELTLQAKKQSSQLNQTRPAATQNKVTSVVQTPKPAATNKTDAAEKSALEKFSDQVADAAQVAQSDMVVTDKLDDAKWSIESNEQKETGVNDTAANLEANVFVLNTPGLIVQSNVTALLNSQNTSTLAEGDVNLSLSSGLDNIAKKQPTLDVMLGQALSQDKNTNTAEKEMIDNALGKLSDQADLVNNRLENESLKAVREDLVTNKTLNALVNKEIVASTPATMQSQVVPVNNALAAAQQTGSASSINVYPGKTGWDQAISQKVIWMVGAGEQSASLTLNPPDLGPLKVVIHVHNDQADTTFISDNDEVRQALENGLSNLRDKMQESGIQLGQANVSTSNQSQQNFQQAAQNRALAQAQNNTSLLQAEAVVKPGQMVRVANGLVDTFV